MLEDPIISVTQQLAGMAVHRPDGGEMLGRVGDAVIDPETGRVTALLLHSTTGERCTVASPDWRLDGDRVLARPDSLATGDALRAILSDGILAAREFLGFEIVDAEQRALGSVRDIFIAPAKREAVYKIGPPFDNLALLDGRYLAGSVARSCLRSRGWIEVPRDVGTRLMAASPAEALDRVERSLAAAAC